MATLRQELQEIYDQNNSLTPALVVEVASNPSHPLHDRFEWDDEKAGDKYRLHQARQLIRSVKIRVIDEEDPGKNYEVRAYQAVRQPTGEMAYKSTVEVTEDPFLSRLVLANMEREWRALRERHEHLREFWLLVNRDSEIHGQGNPEAIERYGAYIAS